MSIGATTLIYDAYQTIEKMSESIFGHPFRTSMTKIKYDEFAATYKSQYGSPLLTEQEFTAMLLESAMKRFFYSEHVTVTNGEEIVLIPVQWIGFRNERLFKGLDALEDDCCEHGVPYFRMRVSRYKVMKEKWVRYE